MAGRTLLDRPCRTGSAIRVACLASFHAGFVAGNPLLRSEGTLRGGLRLVSSNTCGCSTGCRHGREDTATLKQSEESSMASQMRSELFKAWFSKVRTDAAMKVAIK
jgi:hypothetical protein